jgi:molybdopterin molybdotransferase
MKKLSIEEAQALILKNTPTLNSERKLLLQGQGQIASEIVMAKMNVPGYDISALDGFALKSRDIQNATQRNPTFLKMIGRTTAGQTADQNVIVGTAVRIMTGAPLPAGADSVVGFEDSVEPSGRHGLIGITKAIAEGANIRLAGDQIRYGAQVINKGQFLGPGEIGLLASLGLTEIQVVRRPRVAIIATGDELVQPGMPIAGAKIYCGNSSALAAQVVSYGGLPKIMNIARDSKAAIKRQIRRGFQHDIILTTGGSAMGDHDFIKEVMTELGNVIFSQIEVNPGKSSALAILNKESEGGQDAVLHFALSGNITAAMLGFEMLVRPALLKMRGLESKLPQVTAKAETPFYNQGGKTRLIWTYLRQQDCFWVARPAGDEGRGVLQSIAAANGIVVIAPQIRQIAPGESVQVIPLDWR